MHKGLTEEIKERIEATEGMHFVDAAKQRYVIEQRSFRWLSRHWHVNSRTVGRILLFCGIPVRHGGDAVRSQWLDNTERRKQAGECLANTNRRFAAAGLHVRQGKTKANSELIRQIAEKLKSRSSFLREDVRARAQAASVATRSLHPERMSALRNPLSKTEEIMRNYLLGKKLPFGQRVLVGSYVVDFYVPSLSLAIDCQGRSRFPLSYERHACILSKCHHVAYCVNDFVQRGVFTHLDDYISRLKFSSADPSVRCAEAVIFGACGNRPFGDDTDKCSLHCFGMRSNYFTEVSTATDH